MYHKNNEIMKKFYVILAFSCYLPKVTSQSIGNFVSVTPNVQTQDFIFPSSTHAFQKIIEHGDVITVGGTIMDNFDFTGYVPISGSSTNGYLSINHELTPGGVTVMDLSFNSSNKIWEKSNSNAINFSSVVSTAKNCSGTVTPWGTIVSSEETTSTTDSNSDGYHDLGWNVEINPNTKTVIRKLWALGKFKHENIVVHSNRKTVYQGIDDATGYLYKFVATNANDLSEGNLYVYSGSKSGSGSWIQINNTTPTDRNNTVSLSTTAGGTVFSGIEDVEIGPDGWVYFAVKNENRVYRFLDSDPLIGTTVTQMETFVGGMNYDITHASGTTSTAWGGGNDNLAFDNQGNLWVLQDGGDNYIWVVESGHTQTNPKVKLFGIAPAGSEPTGITFTPDFKYLFMSFQHPSSTNNSLLNDASGTNIKFNKDIALVIALKNDLGVLLSEKHYNKVDFNLYPNPVKSFFTIINSELANNNVDVEIIDNIGRKIKLFKNIKIQDTVFNIEEIPSGNYLLVIKMNENIIHKHSIIKE